MTPDDLNAKAIMQIIGYAKNKEVIGSPMRYGTINSLGFRLIQRWDEDHKHRVLTLFFPDRVAALAPSIEVFEAMCLKALVYIGRQININKVDQVYDPVMKCEIVRMYSNDNVEVFP